MVIPMSDPTTKAAEIRAGLVAELRAACVGHPNASIAWPHRVLHQAVDLIEQQAAELARLEQDKAFLKAAYATLAARADNYSERLLAAEAERDELLCEKERLGAGWLPIETAPTDYTHVIGIDAKGDVSRTWFFAPSSITRNWLKVPGGGKWQPVYWMPLREPEAGSGQNLADAHSKSPDPTPSLSERIAVLEAALRPFADFAQWTDPEGWTCNIHREGISVWFGPSDFRRARAALSTAKERGDG